MKILAVILALLIFPVFSYAETVVHGGGGVTGVGSTPEGYVPYNSSGEMASSGITADGSGNATGTSFTTSGSTPMLAAYCGDEADPDANGELCVDSGGHILFYASSALKQAATGFVQFSGPTISRTLTVPDSDSTLATLPLSELNSQATGYGKPIVTVCKSQGSLAIYAATGWTAAPTSKVTIATCTVPAGTMGLNGGVWIKHRWTTNSSANSKTPEVTFGATAYYNLALTTSYTLNAWTEVHNINSASSQFGNPAGSSNFWGAAGTVSTTSTENTANNTTITFSGTTTTETALSATTTTHSSGTCTVTKASHGFTSGQYLSATGGTCTSGDPNANPALITYISSSQFSYPCASCTGSVTGEPSIARYSPLTLYTYEVLLVPGAN